jgi:16S rRNA (cytosine967-C5)-methyltransferase
VTKPKRPAHRQPRDRDAHPPVPAGPPPLNDAARDAAVRQLANQARRWPDLNPPSWRDDTLTPQDAALAHAIYDAAISRWLTLSALLDRSLAAPMSSLEPRMRAVLLAGAAQLLLLDRVPAYAAINHAAEWAKRRIRPGAAGMVNAVLRRTAALRGDPRPGPASLTDPRAWPRDALPLSDGTWLGLTEPALPEDALARVSAAASVPTSLLTAWAETFTREGALAQALHTLVGPPTIANLTHADPAGPPLAEVPHLAPHDSPQHRVFTGTRDELIGLLESRSDIWVQDSASSAAVSAAAATLGKLGQTPQFILDLCAGQGTKTRQLAAAFPSSRIVATDVDADRLTALSRVFAGHPRVRVAPATGIRHDYLAKADLILLDVPCSNTGVLPRRPEARYRVDAPTTAQIPDLQRQIVADAIALLREKSGETPRGRILYSTCSLEPRENSEIASWACRWHRFNVLATELHAPTGLPGDPAARYSDGSFFALLG